MDKLQQMILNEQIPAEETHQINHSGLNLMDQPQQTKLRQTTVDVAQWTYCSERNSTDKTQQIVLNGQKAMDEI